MTRQLDNQTSTNLKRWFLGTCLVGLSALPLSAAQEAETTLSFDQAVSSASASPAVELAEGQLELAQQQLKAASGLVSGSLSTDYTRTYVSAAEAATGDFGPLTLTGSFNVVPYGNVADGVTQAKWAVETAEAVLGATRRDTVVTVATQYLETLRYAQEEQALEAAVNVAQSALDATQTRLEAGASSSADVLDAQIRLSEAQNDLAEVALERDQALGALSQTLGANVAAVSGEPPTVTLPELGGAAARLAERSDVLSARLAVQAAQLSADAALREVLPSGGVSASYSSSDVTLAAGLTTETYQPSLSVAYDPDGTATGVAGTATREGLSAQLSVSIPFGTGSGSALAAAETGVQNAEQQLAQVQAQAGLELQAAQTQLMTAQNSLEAAQALVEQRQSSLATTRTRLGLGLVAPYEVQSAEASLLDAQVQFARLQDSVLLAQLNLLQTLALDPLEVL